jgi:hypothetical protein
MPMTARKKQCPCCGDEAEALFACHACDWSQVPGIARTRARLNRFRRGCGDLAYHPSGCFVCRRCRRQMPRKSDLCPLNVFGAGIEPWQAEAAQTGRADPLAPVRAQWRQWLVERGWPEITEAYWRRMTAYLFSVRDDV